MKTIFQGMNIKTTYSVDTKQITIKDEKGKDKKVYTAKPELKKESIIISWDNIAEIEGVVETEATIGWIVAGHSFGSVHISEDEQVYIRNKIVRIDIPAYIYQTSKVLNEEIVGKEDSDKFLQKHIGWFNKTMIESDEKMLSYCRLHRMNPANTDVVELFKIVYSDDYNYEIDNGKFVVAKKCSYLCVAPNKINLDNNIILAEKQCQ